MTVYKIRHKKTGFYFSGFHYRSSQEGLPKKEKRGTPFYTTSALNRNLKKFLDFDCELDDWEVIKFQLQEKSKKSIQQILPDELKIKELLNLRDRK